MKKLFLQVITILLIAAVAFVIGLQISEPVTMFVLFIATFIAGSWLMDKLFV